MEYNFLLLFIVALVLIIGAFIYLFNRFSTMENQRRNYELRMKYSKDLLPNKLQAYERMTLFLERIRLASLIRRVPVTENVSEYEVLLMETIQSEFEHNLSQQIYIRPETWSIILSAKNSTQLLIKNIFQKSEKWSSIREVQEELLKRSLNEGDSPSSTAILYLQKDIQGII